MLRVGTLQRVELRWSLASMGSLGGRHRPEADGGRIEESANTKLRVISGAESESEVGSTCSLTETCQNGLTEGKRVTNVSLRALTA